MNTAMKPRATWISGAYLAAEAVGGGVAGVALAFVGGFAAGRLYLSAGGDARGFGDLVFAILCAVIGYPIGVSTGVYVIGRWLNGRDGIRTKSGAYWLALLGSVIGALLALPLLGLTNDLGAHPARVWAARVIVSTVSPIVSTLFFNVSLKART